MKKNGYKTAFMNLLIDKYITSLMFRRLMYISEHYYGGGSVNFFNYFISVSPIYIKQYINISDKTLATQIEL